MTPIHLVYQRSPPPCSIAKSRNADERDLQKCLDTGATSGTDAMSLFHFASIESLKVYTQRSPFVYILDADFALRAGIK
jgi:hypothetical protein